MLYAWYSVSCAKEGATAEKQEHQQHLHFATSATASEHHHYE
jgi:hypothetical protein